jgi:hypothetical protein
MTAKFANYQPCPAPEGPGLHSYAAPPPTPEVADPALRVTVPEPEPEAEI